MMDNFNCALESTDDMETPVDAFFDMEQWLRDTGCSQTSTKPANDNA
jgi:hypothetical protein